MSDTNNQTNQRPTSPGQPGWALLSTAEKMAAYTTWQAAQASADDKSGNNEALQSQVRDADAESTPVTKAKGDADKTATTHDTAPSSGKTAAKTIPGPGKTAAKITTNDTTPDSGNKRATRATTKDNPPPDVFDGKPGRKPIERQTSEERREAEEERKLVAEERKETAEQKKLDAAHLQAQYLNPNAPEPVKQTAASWKSETNANLPKFGNFNANFRKDGTQPYPEHRYQNACNLPEPEFAKIQCPKGRAKIPDYLPDLSVEEQNADLIAMGIAPKPTPGSKQSTKRVYSPTPAAGNKRTRKSVDTGDAAVKEATHTTTRGEKRKRKSADATLPTTTGETIPDDAENTAPKRAKLSDETETVAVAEAAAAPARRSSRTKSKTLKARTASGDPVTVDSSSPATDTSPPARRPSPKIFVPFGSFKGAPATAGDGKQGSTDSETQTQDIKAPADAEAPVKDTVSANVQAAAGSVLAAVTGAAPVTPTKVKSIKKTKTTKVSATKTPAAKTPAAKTPATKTPATKTPGTKTPKAQAQPSVESDFVGIASYHGTSTNLPRSAIHTIPWQCGKLDCCTGMTWLSIDDMGRKVLSPYFGRNKTGTKLIDGLVWHIICRKHYQTIKYENDKIIALNKLNGVAAPNAACVETLGRMDDQLTRLELWRPDATFKVQLTKGAKDRLAVFHAKLRQHGNQAAALRDMPQSAHQRNPATTKSPSADQDFPILLVEHFQNTFDGANKTYADLRQIMTWMAAEVNNLSTEVICPMEFLISEAAEDETVNDPAHNFQHWEATKMGRTFDPANMYTPGVAAPETDESEEESDTAGDGEDAAADAQQESEGESEEDAKEAITGSDRKRKRSSDDEDDAASVSSETKRARVA